MAEEQQKFDSKRGVVRNRKTGVVEQYKVIKKQKTQGELGSLIEVGPSGVQRTSSLMAPTMVLEGHKGHVYSTKFDPSGNLMASASHEKLIYLWRVYGECENYGVLKGHTAAVLDLWFGRDGDRLFSASADHTGAVFDVEAGERIKRFRGHSSFVNSICATRRGEQILATGSDDCSAKLWDSRVRNCTDSFASEYQVTCVTFSDDSTQLFTGGIDNDIKCWDLRKGSVLYTLEGHKDSVTGISLSPDGAFLLSNGADNTVRMWDVRPYVSTTRQVNTYQGATHDFQKYMHKCSWSPDGSMVSAGSADQFVYVWDVQTKQTLYKLPGHKGAVSEVNFHPNEPIIVSCGADKTIFLGEI